MTYMLLYIQTQLPTTKITIPNMLDKSTLPLIYMTMYAVLLQDTKDHHAQVVFILLLLFSFFIICLHLKGLFPCLSQNVLSLGHIMKHVSINV